MRSSEAGAPRASRTTGRRPAILTRRPGKRHPGSHRRRRGRRSITALAGLAVAVWSLVGLTADSGWVNLAGAVGAVLGAAAMAAAALR